MSEGTYFNAFISKWKNDQINLTIISNQYKEGDRCTLKMSWINPAFKCYEFLLLYM
jgi:hypothetical protein